MSSNLFVMILKDLLQPLELNICLLILVDVIGLVRDCERQQRPGCYYHHGNRNISGCNVFSHPVCLLGLHIKLPLQLKIFLPKSKLPLTHTVYSRKAPIYSSSLRLFKVHRAICLVTPQHFYLFLTPEYLHHSPLSDVSSGLKTVYLFK